ncbi:hypothetical protein F4780DRAFT_791989 [Xylariomycetidae sp. FL0641]|nr:hypothetical protein F4780DRAFT_791989 [Xylariomycetidae sp. FL0641]
MRALSFYLLPSFVLGALAAEDYAVPSFDGWGISDGTLSSALAHPNATGRLDAPSPGASSSSSSAGDWAWTIRVAADVSAAGADSVQDLAGKYFTASAVNFSAPAGAAPNVDDETRLCLLSWRVDESDFAARIRGDDGSCSSALSDQCVRDVQDQARGNFTGDHCRCPDPRGIASCGESDLWGGDGCVAKVYNASEIRKWTDGQVNVVDYGGPLRDRGNVTAYNSTGSLAWPVMALWKGGEDDQGLVAESAKLGCVRAADGVGGSAAPGVPATDGKGNDDDEGLGVRLSPMSFWWASCFLGAAWMAGY